MIFEEYNEQKAMKAAREHAEKRFSEGIKQGKIKGAIEKQNALVKRMSAKRIPIEEIADITCLQIDEVQKILHS